MLEFEDAVPHNLKAAARTRVRDDVRALARDGQYCAVRIDGHAAARTLDDLQGIMCPEPRAVIVAKTGTMACSCALSLRCRTGRLMPSCVDHGASPRCRHRRARSRVPG